MTKPFEKRMVYIEILTNSHGVCKYVIIQSVSSQVSVYNIDHQSLTLHRERQKTK